MNCAWLHWMGSLGGTLNHRFPVTNSNLDRDKYGYVRWRPYVQSIGGHYGLLWSYSRVGWCTRKSHSDSLSAGYRTFCVVSHWTAEERWRTLERFSR